MKRPYIPLDVRLKVLERQAQELGTKIAIGWWIHYCHSYKQWSDAKRLHWLLEAIFGGADVQLDHDPALSLRKRTRSGGYRPDANDPKFLVYRTKPNHLHKTVGRAPGAERTVTSKGSDVWLAKKFKKLTAPQKRSKSKIASRPFQKTKRGMAGRSSFATAARKDS